VKAHMAERVIRSLRMRMHRLITHRQNERYIDDLQSLVYAYNNAVHSSIGIAPSHVNASNERAIWWMQYWPKKKSKKLKPFLYSVGDLVRISYLRHAFTRGYDYQFSGEVFKVIYRTRRDTIPIYKIEDLAGERVTGTFYNEELTAAPHGDEWKVEKIVRKRKRRGHPAEVYIKWLHFPSKFNSWVNADTLTDI